MNDLGKIIFNDWKTLQNELDLLLMQRLLMLFVVRNKWSKSLINYLIQSLKNSLAILKYRLQIDITEYYFHFLPTVTF